jgi:hypothetical protein
MFMEGFRKARRNERQASYLKGKDLLKVKCKCVLAVTAECDQSNLRLETSRASAKKQECLKPKLMNLKQTVKKYVGGLIMQVVQDITSC